MPQWFLQTNNITVNVHKKPTINSEIFDLLHPIACAKLSPPPHKLQDVIVANVENCKLLLAELHGVCDACKPLIDATCEPVTPVDVIGVVCVYIEQLAAKNQLEQLA